MNLSDMEDKYWSIAALSDECSDSDESLGFSPFRIIGVLDADHFEVQVHQKLQQWSHTKGKPTIVVDANGLIVALSPEAKQVGIKRLQRQPQAQRMCPEVFVIEKKTQFTKPATKELNKISAEIRSTILDSLWLDISQYSLKIRMPAVERSGSDEFFIVLTDYTQALRDNVCDLGEVPLSKFYLEGDDKTLSGQELRQHMEDHYGEELESVMMVEAGQVLEELRQTIFTATGIVCSAGVGRNQLMAKVACKLHKPDAVTCLTKKGFARVADQIDFRDVTGFGGELGEAVLAIYGECNLKDLQDNVNGDPNFLKRNVGTEKFKKVCDIMNGICNKPVKNKLMNNVVNCGKRNLRFETQSEFRTQLNYLAQNFVDRMHEEHEFNKRKTTCIKVQYCYSVGGKSQQKTIDLDSARLNPDSALWKEQREFKAFYGAVLAAVIDNNPDFDFHLPTIHSLNFKAINFNAVTFDDLD